jgi:beta-glucosidase
VITAGSAVDVAAIEPYCDAIIYAWYPGEQGGNALADIIFGKVSPSGKLPVTFYNSLNDLPAYTDYAVKGRTYRYYDGKVQYPFGFGLSYTSFTYDWREKPAITGKQKDSVSFTVEVANTGNYNADEVVQVYVKYPAAGRMPLKELKAFKKVYTAKGKKQQLHFSIPLTELQKWDIDKKAWKLYEGNYTFIVAKHSGDEGLPSQVFIKGNE